MSATQARIDIRRMKLMGRAFEIEELIAAGEAYGYELDAIRDELDFLVGLAQAGLLDLIYRAEQARPPAGVASTAFPFLTSGRVPDVRA